MGKLLWEELPRKEEEYKTFGAGQWTSSNGNNKHLFLIHIHADGKCNLSIGLWYTLQNATLQQCKDKAQEIFDNIKTE